VEKTLTIVIPVGSVADMVIGLSWHTAPALVIGLAGLVFWLGYLKFGVQQ
jgi:hypothetical protein